MGLLDDAWDLGKTLLTGGAATVGTALGGPLVGAAAGAATNWLLGDETGETQVTTQQQGQGQSGGGGAGTSLPPMPGGGFTPSDASGNAPIDMGSPGQPSGGLQGPVYGAQGLGQLMPYVKQVLGLLTKYPQLGMLVQRYWDFPRGEQVQKPNQPLAWALMAKQLPVDMRHALEQFQLGLCAPMGLNKAGQDAFKLLTIAEAGYEPTAIGLCAFANFQNG